jgi:hypothetical protein
MLRANEFRLRRLGYSRHPKSDGPLKWPGDNRHRKVGVLVELWRTVRLVYGVRARQQDLAARMTGGEA